MGAGSKVHCLLKQLVCNRSRKGKVGAAANRPCTKDMSPWVQACISANIITITIAGFLAVIRGSGPLPLPLGYSVWVFSSSTLLRGACAIQSPWLLGLRQGPLGASTSQRFSDML